MSELHEVLAVEKTLDTASRKIQAESIRTLNKENLFRGHVRQLEHFSDENKILNTTDEVTLSATVTSELSYMSQVVGKHWDAVLQKDSGNQEAKADIVLSDGTVLQKDVPVTFLLGLDSKLSALRQVYENIHTLPPGRKWVKDETLGENIYRDDKEDKQFKEEKTRVFRTISEATEHHPAQVTEFMETSKTGEYTTTHTCSLWTPVKKASVMSNLDELLSAVKKARMRANRQTVSNDKISEKLFNFILS